MMEHVISLRYTFLGNFQWVDGEAFRSVCLSARLSLCLCRYGEKEDEGEGQLGGVGSSSSSSSTWLSSTFLATEQPVKINWHKHGPAAAAVSVLYVAHLGRMIQYSPEGPRERRQRVFGVRVGWGRNTKKIARRLGRREIWNFSLNIQENHCPGSFPTEYDAKRRFSTSNLTQFANSFLARRRAA